MLSVFVIAYYRLSDLLDDMMIKLVNCGGKGRLYNVRGSDETFLADGDLMTGEDDEVKRARVATSLNVFLGIVDIFPQFNDLKFINHGS